MTFPMSTLSPIMSPSATKVMMEDEQVQVNRKTRIGAVSIFVSFQDVDEETPLKTLKEIEEEREAEKKHQQRIVT